MKIIKISAAICFLAIAAVSCKTIKIPGGDPLGQIISDASYLASEQLEGRETGTEGEKLAAAYIEKRYKEIGLTAKGVQGYQQRFQKTIKSNPHADEASPEDPTINGFNVLGYVDNKAPKTIVIGAHYDHLGYGGEGSLYTGEAAIHNGADDNASGVAAMLYIAKLVKDNENTKGFNYLFIGFSGEEKGLWGSNHFVNSPTISRKNIAYMINLDMVGRLDKDRRLSISGTGTSPIWNPLIQKHGKGYQIKNDPSGIGPSDHTSFYLKDIPVLFFFTGQHEDYHKPSDDVEKLNVQGIRDIGQFVYKLIADTQGKEIAFTKTKDESADAPRFTVTLGVVPDYLYDGKGMRIDGVREGKVADKFGLKSGDIVIKMGQIDVVDMNSYMKALSSFKSGDSALIKYVRGEVILSTEVKFQ